MNDYTTCHHRTVRLSAQCDEDLKLAREILVSGGIVALPTETVYGLAANGLNPRAIEKVFVAKARPADNPLILHVKDEAQARELFSSSNSHIFWRRFLKLQERFWPGPLTLVGARAEQVPNGVTGGFSSVAIRMQRNEATLKVQRGLGFPLVMPSANLSTRPSPTSADHVLKTLNGRIDAVVDDGACAIGIESTVLRIDLPTAQILRYGAIDLEQLQDCLGERVMLPRYSEDPMPSPGRKYLHYAPKVCSISVCELEDCRFYWLRTDTVVGRRCDLDELLRLFGNRPQGSNNISLMDDAKGFARGLYQALYKAEENPATGLCIVVPSSKEEDWHAVLDRISRTAGFRS